MTWVDDADDIGKFKAGEVMLVVNVPVRPDRMPVRVKFLSVTVSGKPKLSAPVLLVNKGAFVAGRVGGNNNVYEEV